MGIERRQRGTKRVEIREERDFQSEADISWERESSADEKREQGATREVADCLTKVGCVDCTLV